MGRAAGAASLGLGLVLAGATFDSPSLHVPGAALLLLGAGAALWVGLASMGSRVSREGGPHTVLEDEPYPLRIEYTAGLVPAPGGVLIEPLLDAPVRLGLSDSRRIHIDVRFARRGRRVLAPTRIVLHDPLRLASRVRESHGHDEVIVLPRLDAVLDAREDGTGGLQGGGAPRASAASELELDALRPYRPGTPGSRIHWPTVARTGELMERRLVAGAEMHPLVVLDPRAPESEEALDMAVRAAASLTVTLARSGGCGLLLPGDRRPVEVGPDLRDWHGLHVRLALVEAGGSPPASARLQRSGAVFWVSAAGGGRIPVGLERAGAAARWLVTPAARRGSPQFSVSGCGGYRLGRAARSTAA